MGLDEIKELIAVAEKVADSGKEIDITIPNAITLRIGARKQAVQNGTAKPNKPNELTIAEALAATFGTTVEDFKPYEPKTGTYGNS